MKKKFFESAGILLTIAFAVISVIIGIRAGFMNDSWLSGVTVGGAFALGVVMFVIGVGKFLNSDYDDRLTKVVFTISMLGIAVLGLSLSAMTASYTVLQVHIPETIIETGLWLGGGMFALPLLGMMACYAFKALVLFCDGHRKISVITLGLFLIVVAGMYFAQGSLSDALAAACGFLFYWGALCMMFYMWKGVKYEEGVLYWRIGIVLLMAFLSCGIIFIISEMLVQVPVLHEPLVWVAYHGGVSAMYIFIGYLVTVFSCMAIQSAWKSLVRWAR